MQEYGSQQARVLRLREQLRAEEARLERAGQALNGLSAEEAARGSAEVVAAGKAVRPFSPIQHLPSPMLTCLACFSTGNKKEAPERGVRYAAVEEGQTTKCVFSFRLFFPFLPSFAQYLQRAALSLVSM